MRRLPADGEPPGRGGSRWSGRGGRRTGRIRSRCPRRTASTRYAAGAAWECGVGCLVGRPINFSPVSHQADLTPACQLRSRRRGSWFALGASAPAVKLDDETCGHRGRLRSANVRSRRQHPPGHRPARLAAPAGGRGGCRRLSDDEPPALGQEIVVEHDGRPFCAGTFLSWLLNEDGTISSGKRRPRVVLARMAGDKEAEKTLAHPTGIIGSTTGQSSRRDHPANRWSTRSSRAKEYNAATGSTGWSTPT